MMYTICVLELLNIIVINLQLIWLCQNHIYTWCKWQLPCKISISNKEISFHVSKVKILKKHFVIQFSSFTAKYWQLSRQPMMFENRKQSANFGSTECRKTIWVVKSVNKTNMSQAWWRTFTLHSNTQFHHKHALLYIWIVNQLYMMNLSNQQKKLGS